jgi:hypothetical protein
MKEESTMFSKKPSFDESPLQDLSEDQMNQVAGGSSSYKKEMSWDEWNKWNKKHHHHHHRNTKTVKIEIIVTFPDGSKKTYWENAPSSSKW